MKIELDHYQVLGISPKASKLEIKLAYKKLCQKYHPDKNQDEDVSETFMRIRKAYDVLSDPAKKRVYDLTQVEGLSKAEFDQILKNLMEKVVVESLGKTEQFNANWLEQVGLILKTEKINAQGAQKRLLEQSEFLAKQMKRIKAGEDSILVTELKKQQTKIASAELTARTILAVIKFIQSDAKSIEYSFDEFSELPNYISFQRGGATTTWGS